MTLARNVVDLDALSANVRREPSKQPSDLDNDFRAWLCDLRTGEFEGVTLAPSLFAHLRPTSRFRSRLTTSANLLIRAGLASLRVSINAVVQIVWIFGGGQLLDSLMVRAL